jgi:DNA polymerase-1
MATFSPNHSSAWFTYREAELTRYVLSALQREDINLLFWNAKFDLAMLREWCDWRPNYRDLKFTDDMLLQRIVNSGTSAKLKIASQQYTPVESLIDVQGPEKAVAAWRSAHSEKERVGGKYVVTYVPDYSKVPPDIMVPYACQDTVLTVYSHEALAPQIAASESFQRVADRERKLCAVVLGMEEVGWPVNVDAMQKLKRDAMEHLDDAVTGFATVAPGVNPASHPALAKFLYEDRGFPVGSHLTEKGNPSTDIAAIRDIPDDDIREPLMTISRWGKALDKANEFEAALTKANRVHCSYNLIGARTGRFSSEAPNLGNIARYVPDKPWTHARSMIEARPGYTLVFVDLSAIEPRLFTEYSRDPVLLEAFKNDQDSHSVVASLMYSWSPEKLQAAFRGELTDEMKAQRGFAKNIMLTILYGGGVKRIHDSLLEGAGTDEPMSTPEALDALHTLRPGLQPGPDEDVFTYLATALKQAVTSAFPSIKRFSDAAADKVKDRERLEGRGYVENLFGRRTYISPGKSYVAANALIQSCAADLLKEAMIAIDDDLQRTYGDYERGEMPGYQREDGAVLFFGTIYDELLLEVKDEYVNDVAKLVAFHMTNFPTIKVPLKTEVSIAPHGKHWGQKTKLVV